MTEYVDELKSRYAQLEKREQSALVLLAGFLVTVTFYLAIWSPAENYLIDSQVEYDRHMNLLQYLKSTEAEARASGGKSGASRLSGQSMLTAVSRTAQTVGINPSRMQPEGSDAVSVWFEQVDFNKMMLWLEQLESRQGIVVRQVTIDGRDTPGHVSARIVVRN